MNEQILERSYQAKLKQKLEDMFPECVVLKTDPTFIKGFPDLIILFDNGRWATLEVKRSIDAPKRPLQDWWRDKLDNFSFSRFICPENEEEVLNDLYQTF